MNCAMQHTARISPVRDSGWGSAAAPSRGVTLAVI